MAGNPSSDKDGHEKIQCRQCGNYYHILSVHVSKKHKLSIEEYKKLYPGAPTTSEWGSKQISEAQKGKTVNPTAKSIQTAKIGTGTPLAFGAATLKIRDDGELSKTDRKYIPPHDPYFDMDVGIAEMLALGIQHEDNILVIGPTGGGKTATVKQLGCLISQPVRRANLHGDVRASDFVGEKIVEVDPETNQAVVVWRDGVLPDAMRNGYWLLLDEVDAATPQILFVLQAVLDSGQLVLTANHGEVIEPDSNFRIIATANTTGQGDETGLYAGTNILNEAFLDRFGTVIIHNYLKEEKEAKVVARKTSIDQGLARKMVEVAAFVRNGLLHDECHCTLSTRRLIMWGRKIQVLGTMKAAHVALLNKLSKEDQAYVGGIIQRVLGN